MSASEQNSVAAPNEGWETLARAAASREREQENRQHRELLCFAVDDSFYLVPVERVREIVRMRQMTPVPRVPEEILGVISLRGEIVQVLDLRLRMAAPAPPPTPTHRIVVLHGDGGEISGLLVDRVHDVMRVDEEEMQPTANGASEFVGGLFPRGNGFAGMLNLEKVLDLDAV